ncbi:MAG: response regulator [Acidobacteria bacterium]|nr:response regulator [Acidobacteriota bacterium]MBV9144962.1 response regulator [Acidobacteriota bacterium]MBV9435738.1 response regulator [Acidobacteriota bacterium]
MTKVLLIEEDAQARAAAESALAAPDLTVKTAPDFQSGLDLLRVEKPTALVIGVVVPDLRGYDLCQEIRRDPDFQHLPIVICSAQPYPADARRAKELGADDYVVKPYAGQQLLDAVWNAIELNSTVFRVKFWGTRGSIATPGPETVRYGGNTACVEVRCGEDIIIFDCGTGIRELGLELAREYAEKNLEVHLFVSHTHWDHIQGFPFFQPAYRPGNRVNIFSLHSPDRSLEKLFTGQMDGNYFPVTLDDLMARLHFEELVGDVQIGDVKISHMHLNHPGLALSFRMESKGRSFVYMTDHEPYQKLLGESAHTKKLDAEIDAFAKHADLLIREAQYTDEEYLVKKGWGHSSTSDAASTAMNADVKKLVLFHHDPMHDDQQVDAIVESCREKVSHHSKRIHVMGAADKLTLRI